MRSSNASSKLYVGDLGDNRKADLTRVFSKYGEISTIYVDENKHFAFVEFTSPSDAQRALERTNHKTVNGSKLRVEFAKSDKPPRRALSRERSPTTLLYSHLQVTANRLPPMPVFRHSYHQHPSSTSMPTSVSLSSSTSRGRSLTPPSLKHNPRLPPMHQLRAQEFYYPPLLPPPHHHPAMYSDPTYYPNYVDPYLAQRLPPTAFVPAGSSRAFRNMYSPPGNDRYLSGPSAPSRHRRSRSRRRYESLLSIVRLSLNSPISSSSLSFLFLQKKKQTR